VQSEHRETVQAEVLIK